MLNVENVKAHGMRDHRWTNRDKLNQIHGLIQLKKRDKKQGLFEVNVVKNTQCEEIKELKKDIVNYRSMLKTARSGDQQRIRNTLRAQRATQLALKNKSLGEAIEHLDQSNFIKGKELNSLRCKEIQLMRKLLNLQVEASRLEENLKERLAEPPNLKKEQSLSNLISRTMVKQNAASSVLFTYKNILTVLKKDSMYFAPVLEALQKEYSEQCQATLKITGIGQMVTEELADVKVECRRFEEKLKLVMNDRSEAVNQMRMKVDHNRSLCKALVRVDSATDFGLSKPADADTLECFMTELQNMESIMQKLRNITLVSTTDEIFCRMQDQIKVRDRLLKITERKRKKRDIWLKRRNHAQVIRDQIMHNMGEFTIEYKNQKSSLNEGIEEKRTAQQRDETAMEELGRFMVSMRAALFTVAAVLDHVRPPPGVSSDTVDAPYRWSSEDAWLNQLYARKFEPNKKAPNDNAMKLLEKIFFKAGLLMEQSSVVKHLDVADYRTFSLVPEIVVGDHGEEVEEESGAELLEDVHDPNVPTRADIKSESKKIIDYFARLPEMVSTTRVRKPRRDDTKWLCANVDALRP